MNSDALMNSFHDRVFITFLSIGAVLASMLLALPVPAFASSQVAGQNWPQWRGPLGNGIAPQANPPVKWSETENIKWKVAIPGKGSATPIVWGNQVFIQTAISQPGAAQPGVETATPPPAEPAPTEPPRRGRGGGRGGFGGGSGPLDQHQFVILSLDRQTGKVLWQQAVREETPHEGHHRDGTFASSSPVTDGRHVLAFFGSRGLHCYDMNGKLQWSQDLGKMRISNTFGEGSSPALYGDTVVVKWDHEGDSFILALDKNTGKTRWKTPRDERTSWSTPLIIEHEGKPQIITTATGKVRSYDLHSGELIWECAGLLRNVIPTPVVGHGMVYAMSGFSGYSLLAIRLGHTGDLTDTDAVAWTHRRNTPYVPSPLLYGDKLYFFRSNSEVLSCFDARSGRVLIDAEQLSELRGVYASPAAANGRIYFVGRNGVAAVVKASDQLEVLATNRLDDPIDASPALVGNELFLRGQTHLYCIAEK
jgi:outer membrane protein assembly factor BamB